MNKGIYIGNIRGPKGDTGNGLTISNYFDTISELPSNPSAGDAYGIKNGQVYDIYIYSPNKGWVNNGALQPDINEQAPNYAEATTLESLTSGEKISIAFGKIKKAIKELISHIGNTSNPHNVTPKKIGAYAVGENVVTGTKQTQSTDGGIRLGIMYIDESVPYVGVGTERGSNSTIIASGCDHTNYEKEIEIGERCYYYPIEANESLLSFPAVLKVSNTDGKLYYLKSTGGLKHYNKNEVIPMSQHEVIHTGNLTTNKVARIETQSYTGNGLYGVDNARTFTFSFLPRMFFISGYGPGGGNYTLTVPQGFPFVSTVAAASGGGFTTVTCNFNYSGNSITMYNPSSATNGLNIDGSPYLITAIGY